jgi:hypothetical protein
MEVRGQIHAPVFISEVGLSPLGTAATSGLLYKPQMIDEGDYGATDGMMIGRGHRSTRRKPAPAPLCPPQIPHDPHRGCFNLGEGARSTHWIGTWVSPRDGLDAVEKRNIFPVQGIEPRTSSPQPVAIPTELCQP